MAQKGNTLEKSDDAVSEIIGELMMLVITVMIFVILIASISAMISKQRTEIVHMNALAINDTAMLIQHTGGDTIAYGQLAVVVNGNLIPALISDSNGNGLWDLGESLYVNNIDTRQSLSVMVYDSITKVALGDFTVDTIPAGIPVPSPSSTPTPTPTVTATPTPTPTPTPQATIAGSAQIKDQSTDDSSKVSGWTHYTVNIVLTVSNTGSVSANKVLASCTPPDNGAHINNVKLISSPTPNPLDVPGSSSTQYTWSYSLDVQKNHEDSAVFGLSAQGDNTNKISMAVTLK